MTAESRAENPPAARPPPPILVAEDDESAVELIARFLQAMWLVNPIVAVGRGDDAIRALEDAEPPPALALLDIHMPGASGLEVLRWMRNRPAYQNLPVIILTGSADLCAVNESHGLGVVHFLVKPVGFDALDDVLRRVELPWALLPPIGSHH